MKGGKKWQCLDPVARVEVVRSDLILLQVPDDWMKGTREGEESRMIPGLLNWGTGKMELPITWDERDFRWSKFEE